MSLEKKCKFSIGLATFWEQDRQKIEAQPISEQLIEALDEENFTQMGIQRELAPSSFTKLLGYMRQAQFESMIVSHELNVLELMVQIKFHNLVGLYLENDDIVSIESVAFLDAPQLQAIYFQYNLITVSKSLLKTNWPRLSSLCIEKNPLKELDFPRIRNARDESEAIVYNSVIVETPAQDLSVMAKIQQREPGLIFMMGKRKINQIKVSQVMRRRHPGGNFSNMVAGQEF